MNDSHDDRADAVSDVFERVTPHRDVPEGLLAGARRKRQQRRLAASGVAALVVLGLAVPLAALMSQQNTIPANPASTSTPLPPEFQGLTNPCLDPDQSLPEPTGALETGATRVWLCGDYVAGDELSASGMIGPLEPLVNDVDQLIETWESYDPLAEDIACTMEYRLTYNLVFDYDDQTQRVLRGELHGCRTLSDGTTNRSGGEELFDLAVGMWQEQRDALPEFENPYVPCRVASSIMSADLEDVNRGSLCVLSDDGSQQDSARLPDDLVEQVRDAIAAEAEPVAPEDQVVFEDRRWLELVTRFADPIRLNTDATGEVYEWWADEGLMRWEPSTELQEALAVLADELGSSGQDDNADPGTPMGTGSNQDPQQLPEPFDPAELERLTPWAPEICQEAVDGEMQTSAIPAEGEPEEIWLCAQNTTGERLSVVPPAEPLTLGVSEAMAALRGLDSPVEPDQGCDADLGAAYYVVHVYPDGSQHAVEVRLYGCRDVVVGEETFAGAVEYFDILQELWAFQRAELDEPVERPAPLCPQLSSSMPIQHTDEFTSGSMCRIVDGQVDELPLDAGLVTQVSSELDGATVDPASQGFGTGNSVVLVTRFGDPYLLLQAQGSWLSYVPDGSVLTVTFSPEVEAQLDELMAS